jgi:hypothetical protein
MNVLAATGHAGPNGDGWIVIALLAAVLIPALLLALRNRRRPR